MEVILFDTADRKTLYPFTAIRPVADLRTGILSNRERWELLLKMNPHVFTESYLHNKHPLPAKGTGLYIDARLIPSSKLVAAIQLLTPGNGLTKNGEVIAAYATETLPYNFTSGDCKEMSLIEWPGNVELLQYPFQLVQWNDAVMRFDFDLITANRTSQPISSSNYTVAPEHIFIEEGAVVENCSINASAGPVYIGKNSLLMEGAFIRGPFAMLENAVVKMGAKIYGATTVGRQCTVGGEIKNTQFFDYSNKAHDGYVGDAVIGEWCNIGAGTSCSNIKNTAGEIKIWNQPLHQWIAAGTKCGMMLGDYTKVSINSSLTTGMVSGICSNVLTEGLSAKYIADFTWNIHTGEKYIFEKAVRDIENWMQLKQQTFTTADKAILQHIYNNKP
ncbi:MAG: glucose-1-phosphate thymidylyltransferase [Chitinophagaceae bacterium]|jgi:UDP-N-acetylglucosamine diphosphorylase / glucose-1-phosphate thymidylyltransferase / UDP-N-acetylgalactosamine diphosphorylase / glucosamine-1-phosphate N-acetyltransferase / galactosamine-1-phosphate N-acetyltransferase|nr:glucose-1-phosphate thymidylyltransferase [Chitinophagaceae bacterium]